jgi:hypothetical protein
VKYIAEGELVAIEYVFGRLKGFVSRRRFRRQHLVRRG